MSRWIVGVFGVLVATSLWAQVLPHGSVSEDDRVSIVAEDEIPGGVPPKFQRQTKKQIPVKDVDGVSFVGDQDYGLIRGLAGMVAAIERASSQVSTKGAKKAVADERLYGLVFDAEDIKLTRPMAEVPEGKLIGATPSGTFKNGRWTGIARYDRLNDGALVELTEQDLSAMRGMLYMVPESINTEINGKPAQATVFHDASGRGIRQVMWVDGPKSYRLLVLPPAQAEQGGAIPKGHQPDRSAIALARTLKLHSASYER